MLEYIECTIGKETFYYICFTNLNGLLFKQTIINTGLLEEDVLQIINKYNVKIFGYDYIEYYGFENEDDAKQVVEELNFLIKMVT